MLAGTPATAILTADIKMMLRYSCLFMVRNSWRHFFHLNFKLSKMYARTCCFILNLFLFCQMGHPLEALRPTMSFWRVQMGWYPAWWLDSHRWMFSGLRTSKKSLMVRAKNGNIGPAIWRLALWFKKSVLWTFCEHSVSQANSPVNFRVVISKS